jgi:hypothetical protein
VGEEEDEAKMTAALERLLQQSQMLVYQCMLLQQGHRIKQHNAAEG